jgi:MarR family transcriptional regulator, transcriptional regulator for hemolysin
MAKDINDEDRADDRSLGFLISDAARLMRTVFDRRVRRLGLTRAQWLVLARLHRRPGASQSELAEMMEVEKASAGRMVDRLERKGWIERRADPVDRRVNRLYLTAEAEKISLRMRAVAEQTVGDALSDLAPEQAGELANLMSVVKVRLVAMAANPEPAEAAPQARSATRRGGPRSATPETKSRNKTRNRADAHGMIAGGNTR